MARLLNPESGLEETLLAPTYLGRSRQNRIVVADPRVSQVHACLYRRGEAWHVESLAGTNGTWVDGVLLNLHETRQLSGGTQLRFGHAGTDSCYNWILTDDSPPDPALIGEEKYLQLLTSEETHVGPAGAAGVVLRRQSLNPTDAVILRRGSSTEVLLHGDRFDVEGQSYELALPEELVGTVGARSPESLCLKIFVSSCQEEISLEFEFAGVSYPFPVCGEYAEVIYRLADLRLSDRKEGVPPEREGYTDELSRLVNKSKLFVNSYCSRINKAAKKLGLVPSGALIVYDKSTKKRRLDLANIQLFDRSTMSGSEMAAS